MSEQGLLMLPHTSTIMMRRNSAMDRSSKENVPNITTSPSLSGLTNAGGSNSTGGVSHSSCGVKNKSIQHSPVSQQPVICGRRPR